MLNEEGKKTIKRLKIMSNLTRPTRQSWMLSEIVVSLLIIIFLYSYIYFVVVVVLFSARKNTFTRTSLASIFIQK